MREFLFFHRAMLGIIKLPRLLLFSLLLLSTSLFAQVDKEFWFSIPHSTVNHGYSYPMTEGGQPIKLRVATLSRPATIVVSFPATTLAPLSIDLLANQQYTFDKLDSLRNILTLSGTGNKVEDKGILIQSTEDITAYLELACKPNPEIFSLKGTNALGTKFYTPFQTRWPNDTVHNRSVNEYYYQEYWSPYQKVYFPADSAFSSIDIVATEDGTVVEITPTDDIIGCAKGKTLKVVLNRGQVYSARAKTQGLVNGVFNRAASNLSGSLVISNKKIGVIVRDDSVLPTDITVSGDKEDYIGDQLVPVNLAGKEYIVIKGKSEVWGYTNQSRKVYTPHDLKEYFYVVGTENGTNLVVDGVSQTINAGQTLQFVISGATSYVKSSSGVYVFHVSGYNGETSGAILPSIDRCSGSDQIGFVRTYGSMKYKNYDVEQFYMNILVKKGGESGFMLDDKPLSSYSINGSAITFSPVSQAPEWVYTQVKFPRDVLVVGPHILSNTKAYFHMGFINTTIHNWASDTSQIGNPQDIGANYGYFSNYKEVRPEVRVINTDSDKFGTWACTGLTSDIGLKGQGGSAYIWSLYRLNEATKKWMALSASESNDFYFKTGTYSKSGTSIDAERPVIDKSIPIGSYKYVANITSKVSCSNDTADTVYITIEPCINFPDTSNCFCESKAGTGVVECMNLKNMQDDILGKYADRFTLSGWFTKHPAVTYSFDNFDGVSNVSYGTPSVGAFATAANPGSSTLNSSASVGMFTGTAANGGNTASLISIPFSFKDANLLSLKEGKLVNLSVAAKTSEADMLKTISVALALKTANGFVTTDFQDITAGSALRPWQKMTFDLSKYDNTVLYSQMYFVIKGAAVFEKNVYFDDIQWNRSVYLVSINDADCHRVKNLDTVYTVVKSKNTSALFADTVRVINYIHASSAGCSLIPLRDTICALSGNCFEKYNLTRFTDSATTSLAARLSWYYDKSLTTKVSDSSNISSCSNAKNNIASFYLKVDNNCTDHVDSLNVFVNPKAVVSTNPVASICSKAGDVYGSAKLNDFKTNVTKDPLAKIMWYKDQAMTSAIDGNTLITVNNKDVFYARVYVTDVNCYEIKPLSIVVKRTPKSVFRDTAVCANKFPVTLVAAPIGSFSSDCGVTSEGVVNNISKDCKVMHLVVESGCRDSSYATITLKTVPQISIVPHDAIPFQTATQLTNVTIKDADEYHWSDAATLEETDVMQPKTKILKFATTFKVTAVNANGCSDSASTLVTVNDAPPIIIVAPAVCLKDQVTASVEYTGGYSPYTYKWTASTGATSTNAIFNFPASKVGKVDINVVITDSKGSVVDTFASTVVRDKPVLADLFAETCVGVAKDVNIDMTHQSVSPYTFTWFGSNVNNVLTTTSGISTSIKTTAVRGQYPLFVKAVDANGCSDTADLDVEIHGNPIVTINKDFKICNNQCKALSAEITGEGTPDYILKWSNALDANAVVSPNPLTSSSVLNPTFCAKAEGKSYLQLKVTDKYSCIATDQITVDVKANPVLGSIEAPSALCKNANSSVLSACLATAGVGPYEYKWSIDDQMVAGFPAKAASSCSNIVYSVPDNKNEQIVKYSITDVNGCSDSLRHTIIINPVPAFDFSLNPDSVCLKNSVTINAVSDDKTVTYEYYVNRSGTRYPITNASFTPDKDGSYLIDVVAKNKFSCNDEKSKTLVVYPLPEVDLKDIDVCRLTCKVIESTVTSTTKISTYNWLLNNKQLSGASTINPTFCAYDIANQTNKVILKVIDEHGCSASDSSVITVREKPIASIEGAPMRYELADKAFDLKASATGGTPSYSYKWSPADKLTSANDLATVTAKLTVGQSTSYSVYVEDSYTCKDTAQIQINIEGQPHVVVKPIVVCQNDKDTVLEAIIYDGSPSVTYEYAWYKIKNSKDSVVVGNDRKLVINTGTSGNEIYRVVVTPKGNAVYEKTSDTAIVYVNPAPVFNIDNHNKSSLCAGDTVKLTTVPVSDFYYSWPDGLKFNNPYIFEAINVDGKPYTVTKSVIALNEKTGCKATKSIDLRVNMLPSIAVTPSKSRVCTKDPAVLTATVTPANVPYSYRWILNGETIYQASNVYSIPAAPYIPTPIQTNDYVVKVKDDVTGCEQSTTVSLDIVSRPKGLDIPNICTGDNQLITIGLDEKVTWKDIKSVDNWKLDTSNAAKPLLTATNAGQIVLNYRLLKNGNECPLDTQKTVSAVKTPTVKIDDKGVCQGKSADFSVIEEGGVTYSWFVDNIQASSTGKLHLNDLSSGNKIIIVKAERVTAEKSCPNKDDATLQVWANPIVSLDIDKGNLHDFAPFDDPADLTAVVNLVSGSPLSKVSWSNRENLTSADETINGLVYHAITNGDVIGDFAFSVEDQNGCMGTDNKYISRYGKAIVELFFLKSERPKQIDSLVPFNILDASQAPLYSVKDYGEGHDTSIIAVRKKAWVCNTFTIGLGVSTGDMDKFNYSWTRKINGVVDSNFNDTFNDTLAKLDGVVSDENIYTYIGTATYKKTKTSISREIIIERVHFPALGELKISPVDEIDKMYYENTPLTLELTGLKGLSPADTVDRLSRFSYKWSQTGAHDSLFTERTFAYAKLDSLSYNQIAYSYSYTLTSKLIPTCSINRSAAVSVKHRYRIPFKIRNTCANAMSQQVCVDSQIPSVLDGNYKWTFAPADAVIIDQSASNFLCMTFIPSKEYKKVYVTVEDSRDRNLTSTYPTVDSFEIFPEFKIADIKGKRDVCVGEISDYEVEMTNPSMLKKTIADWELLRIAPDTALHGRIIDSSFTDCDVKWKSVGQNNVYAFASYISGYRCYSKMQIPVTVHDVIAPKFIHVPDTGIYSGTEVKFVNLTYGPYTPTRVVDTTNIAFQWDFVGDGVYAAERFEPVYAYDHFGIFDVHLLAEDKRYGCKKIVSDTLVVKKNYKCDIVFPNTFMPEAEKDKTFSGLKQVGIMDNDFNLRVFNRWGQLLWETNDRRATWDGVYQGAISKQDVYVYHCKVMCEDGTVKNIKGDVTLLR